MLKIFSQVESFLKLNFVNIEQQTHFEDFLII